MMVSMARWRGGSDDYDAGFYVDGRGYVSLEGAMFAGVDADDALGAAARWMAEACESLAEVERLGWEHRERLAMRVAIVATEVAQQTFRAADYGEPSGELDDRRDTHEVPALARFTVDLLRSRRGLPAEPAAPVRADAAALVERLSVMRADVDDAPPVPRDRHEHDACRHCGRPVSASRDGCPDHGLPF